MQARYGIYSRHNCSWAETQANCLAANSGTRGPKITTDLLNALTDSMAEYPVQMSCWWNPEGAEELKKGTPPVGLAGELLPYLGLICLEKHACPSYRVSVASYILLDLSLYAHVVKIDKEVSSCQRLHI